MNSRCRVAFAALVLVLLAPGMTAAQLPEISLADAARLALEWHPAARAADATERAAGARLGQVSADRYPNLAVEGSAVRFQEPMVVFPIHVLDPSRLEFNSMLIQSSLHLGYTLFDGGGRGSTINSARSDLAGAAAARAATEAQVIVAVTNAYLRVLSADAALHALDQRLAAVEAERQRASLLSAEGAAAAVESLRAAAALQQTLADRAEATAELRTATNELARLTHIAAEQLTPDRLTDRGTGGADVPDRGWVITRLAEGNPVLAQAQSEATAADWMRRAAAAAWFPRIDLIGGYTLFGSASGSFTGEWQGGVRVTYPLFAGGKRPRAIAAAAARAEAVDARVDATELDLERGADRILAALASTASRQTALEAAERHLAEVVRIERLALDEGAGTQAEYLRAEAELSTVRATVARTRHGAIALRVELAALTGELSVAWLETLTGVDR
jgi:outer membrane protein